MSNPAARDAPVICPAEAARRRDAVRQATASIRLEGGTVSEADLALDEQYISGRIDIDTYVAAHLPKSTPSVTTRQVRSR
jgi:Antitoxin VbhA